MAIWVADGSLGLFREKEQLLQAPCFALCIRQHYSFAAGQQRGYCLHGRTGRVLFDFPLPGGVCDLDFLGPHLCALSTEADCLWALNPHSGALCLSAPAGNYPRHFAPSPCGRYAAVAGGAAGEVLVLDAQLQCIRKIRVPGTVVSLCFLPRGMAVLCAVGDDQVSSRLYTVSVRGVVEEVFSSAQPPCTLCALPGGRLLMGCHGSIWQLHEGRPVGRIPCVYPRRIRNEGRGFLYADAWQGTVKTKQGETCYRGKEPADMMTVLEH